MFAATVMQAGASFAESLDACALQVDAAPGARDGYRCAYLHARKTGEFDASIARLRVFVGDTDARPRPDRGTGRGWAILALANCLSDQGIDEAPAQYERAVAQFVVVGDAAGEVNAQLGLSTWFGYGDELLRVDSALARAMEVALGVGDRLLVATVKIQRARQLYHRDGNIEEVIALAREAEAVMFPDGPYQGRLMVLYVLSNALSELSDVDEEVRVLARFIALTQAEGDAYVEASARMSLTELGIARPSLVRSGLVPDPRGEWKRATQLARRSGNQTIEASGLCKEGSWQAAHGEGLTGLNACLALAVKIDNEDRISEAHERLALALSAVGTPASHDAARRHAESAIEVGERRGTVGVRERLVLARVVAALGGDATPIYADLAKRLKRRLGQAVDADRRVALMAGSAYAFYSAAEFELERGRDLEALAWIERMRSRAVVRNDQVSPIAEARDLNSEALGRLQASLSPVETLVIFSVPTPTPLEALPSPSARAFVLARDTLQVVELPRLNAEGGLRTRVRVFADRLAAGEVASGLAMRLGSDVF
ncbi:MAG: hypothetical protein JKY37_19715, partial [Nannocystaceae bacterium]|nr:hypothetical protein [Nannocystaceae bacterium]